jgi:hypothetical protein
MGIVTVKSQAQALAYRLDRVIDGRITNISILIGRVTLPGAVKSTAVDVADAEEVMKLSYKTEDNTTLTLSLPTIKEEMTSTVPGGAYRIFNLLDSDAAAMHAIFIDAATEGVGFRNPADKRGAETLRLIRTRMTFKPRKK